MLRLAGAAAIGAFAVGVAVASPLDDLKWSKRVLLVFAAAGDAELGKQRQLLSVVPAAEVADRDLVVLLVPPEGTTSTLFGKPAGSYSATALRKVHGIDASDGFTALLLGKDGGTKWRENRPGGAEELFGLIDSMPMRMREMDGNGGEG
jgi:hypothetical protein